MKVPLTTADFLERAAHSYGDRVGVVDEPNQPGSLGEMTYTDFYRRTRALVVGLDSLGLAAGERVALVSKNSAQALLAYFGVTAYGRVLVPINFRLKPEEIAHIIGHSGATTLLMDPEVEPNLTRVECRHRFVLGSTDDGELYRDGKDPQSWDADEEATATINYTSGTTARPKGVQLTHRNCWINAVLMGLHLGVSDRDVYLHALPMFHVNGWGMLFTVTGMGGTHIVLRQVDGVEILRRVDRYGVTLMCSAPAVVKKVLDAAQNWPGEIPGRDRLRLIVAGAPPPSHLIEQVERRLGWEFIQIYGLTETSPLLTTNRAREEHSRLDATKRLQRMSRAGTPALGVQLKISEEGEVLARGNVVLQSYWEDDQATEDSIREGWFHTGDGGVLDDEHYLSILDRKKDVIITGGENVSSIEVENVLFSHSAVAEVAVIGIPSERWGETIKALVVMVEGRTVTQIQLIDYCRERLAHFKCPTSVEFRDELARTATGKLQKYKLRESYWKGQDKQVH